MERVICGASVRLWEGNQNFYPGPSTPGFFLVARSRVAASPTVVDRRQLAAVCRIKALWRLHCCALLFADLGRADARLLPGLLYRMAGSASPPGIQVESLPPEVEAIAPQLHEFGYIVVEELIAIADERSRKIVIVIPRWG
jgi:hypothetical protein